MNAIPLWINELDVLDKTPTKWIRGKDAQVILQPILTPYGQIPVGFEWDGASIPIWLVSQLFISPFHHTVRRASLYHDYLYSIQANRKDADKAFIQYCRQDGANKIQCAAMYAALRIGGWYAYKQSAKEKK